MASRATILVVEGNPHLRAAVQRLLEARGYEVVAVESTSTALALVSAGEKVDAALVGVPADDFGVPSLTLDKPIRCKELERAVETLLARLA